MISRERFRELYNNPKGLACAIIHEGKPFTKLTYDELRNASAFKMVVTVGNYWYTEELTIEEPVPLSTKEVFEVLAETIALKSAERSYGIIRFD